MIVDPTTSSRTSMAKDNVNDELAQLPSHAPPSYDAVVNGGNVPGRFMPESAAKAQDVKVPSLSHFNYYSPRAGPSVHGQSRGHFSETLVYHYINPSTGERVASLLPPDHPQMICLQEGGHVTSSKFGILGVLAAIIWFPLGIGLCLLDRKVYCRRCGVIVEEGMCG